MSGGPRDPKVRCVRLGLHAFELWLAAAAVVSGVTQLTGWGGVASRTVQAVAPNLVVAYAALYGLGGVAVLVGLWRGSPRLEGAGLCLLAAGILVSAAGLLAALGPAGATSAALQGAAAVACVVRLRMLAKGRP